VEDDSVINPEFTKLHHPCYWHYDVLFGLKVMCEAGLAKDRRCSEALDLLESKRLPDGGFATEAKFYRGPSSMGGRSLVNWGSAASNRANEFATADALWVLKQAGRGEP